MFYFSLQLAIVKIMVFTVRVQKATIGRVPSILLIQVARIVWIFSSLIQVPKHVIGDFLFVLFANKK